VTTESRLRRKKRRRVFGIVFQFLFFAAFCYLIGWFVLDSRLWRLLAAVAVSAWLTHALSTDKTIGRLQRGQQVRCPRCNSLGITIRGTGDGVTCSKCKGKSTWAEVVTDQRASRTDGAG
jgi:hypothetical protein